MSVDRGLNEHSRDSLRQWLASCTRAGKVSRNTIAIGIVALDHLRRGCPASKTSVFSRGGELKGARSGLKSILGKYGIQESYLKEATTRQAHQDAQRLFELLDWGRRLAELSSRSRDALLLELIQVLADEARRWLEQQNLKLDLDRRQGPVSWIEVILQNAEARSGGVVEQHLIGAKLAVRFPGVEVPNHPAHAGDRQTARDADFAMSRTAYHVTAAPSRDLLRKCARNIAREQHPVLLVPRKQTARANVFAEEEGIEKAVTIIAIEDFVAMNVIELATQYGKDHLSVLREIVDVYNRRLAEVETDLSLSIELH